MNARKAFPKVFPILVAGVVLAGCQAAEDRYSSTALKESVTHKNPEIKYNADILAVGAPREEVIQEFGPPNGSDTQANGVIEDVYIFLPDGSKYVNPSPRGRNVAMGVVTMGASVVVHQAMLAHQRSKLTIYHVYYGSNGKILRVEKIAGSAFKPATKP